ncbi:MAG: FG-GAP repeat domain-containing protein [Planctomycetota bacterium]
MTQPVPNRFSAVSAASLTLAMAAAGSSATAQYKAEPVPVPAAGGGYRVSAALGDIDGDDVMDLVMGRNGGFDWRRGLTEGPKRTFAAENLTLGCAVSPSCESAGEPRLVDVDNDGDLDLLTLDDPSLAGVRRWRRIRAVWFANAGDGTFGEARALADREGKPLDLAGEPSAVALADWDGDGVRDFLVATPSIHLHRGAIGGGFASKPLNLGVASRSFAVVDWDGDGQLDLVTAEAGAVLLHLRGGGGGGGDGGGLLAAERVGKSAGVLAPLRLTLCDWDGAGGLDLLVGDHVEQAPVAAPASEAEIAQDDAELAAAERMLAVVQQELERLKQTPPQRTLGAMKRRSAWREELQRWSVGPEAVRTRILARRRQAQSPPSRGIVQVLLR